MDRGEWMNADAADFLQQLMTVEEVAKLLALKPSTVRAYAERGSLACVRIGNRLRFRGSDVSLWIARRFEKGGA
jgi:excisionase family DNA binding protein